MLSILEYILTKSKVTNDEIKQKLKKEYTQASIFKNVPQLKNRNIYEHINKYYKIRNLTLEDLISSGAINIEEKNADHKTLLQLFIIDNKLPQVKTLLCYGARLYKDDFDLANNEQIQDFLNYRPGQGNPSILEYCSKRARPENYLQMVKALILDYNETTDNYSSDEERFSDDELNDAEITSKNKHTKKLIATYNKDNNNEESKKRIRLIAARGVHFGEKYFKPKTIKYILQTKNQPKATYSQSTQFDSGYTADKDVPETNVKIQRRHKKNVKFFKDMEKKNDIKEKKIGTYTPPISRNNKQYTSLIYRFMQVYINSYNTLFNIKSIQIDFGFDSTFNPLVSASWNFTKSGMYGSGFRFDWEKRELRRNPHYRRFTGKPKHPNMGYVDVYAFDIEYVRVNGYDRQIMCKNGNIFLSAFYRHEAEIIFISMIPAKYHQRRCIISLPNFEKPFDNNKSYFASHNISKIMYNKYKCQLLKLPKSSMTDEHSKVINSITEKTSNHQANRIEKTAHCRLFREPDKKVVAYDHGDKLSEQTLTL